MKIGNIDTGPWTYLIIATIGFILGVAVGVKATLSNITNKIQKAHQLHPSTNDNQGSQGDKDFHKSIHEMFIGPYPPPQQPN